MKKGYLYIKIDKNNLLHNKIVYIKDIAKLYCTETDVVDKLYQQVVLIIKEDKKSNYIFSILKLIEIINRAYPDIPIVNLGEIDFIIQYDPPKKENKIWEVLKVGLVSCMVFFGAAFTIMSFNEDANVKDVFDTIYQLVLGEDKLGGSVMELAYAAGLPLGIILFFNHFSKAKLGNDPTPMQVQMRVYEEDLDKTLIENAGREGKSHDVR
ncbi:stage V sporulation protein AA [Anaerocolumna cellulosilytica]|uniref:Stage V sporulation protein AA n=1 Tax=Anaerocolumna cellulosilytica TaxID=433286 RepID=A0A6S6RBI6_9FIRM|nr:stage V sporulation protein AA [Anaerocolumna cellulosilytica]MBB5195012.1 stage V sporulation protein AA [Anaerocolumna cellulosilytica]BCJ96151.1 stage V sporulation protein AA [Anaerocolumna cellulosilytica]